MATSRRDELIDTALRLFYANGFHATGIDKILAEAGIAKMTLYKHFRSKDELILAALRRRDEQFREWFRSFVAKASPNPREQLLAVFDALDEWINGRAEAVNGFRGCAFIRAAGEFGEPSNPIHQAAAEHKDYVIDYLEGIAREAGAQDPRDLAEQIALLKEGVIVTAEVRQVFDAAARAKAMARVLISAACRYN